MKQILILVALNLCFYTVVFSQEEINKKQLLLGTEFGFSSLFMRNPSTEEVSRNFSMRWNPYLGFFFTQRLALGATGTYEFTRGNVFLHEPAYGVGAFVEYLLPLRSEERNKQKTMDRLALVFRGMYLRTNFYLDSDLIVQTNTRQLENHMGVFDFGLNYRILNQLYLQLVLRNDIFITPQEQIIHGFNLRNRRFAIEYHFGK